jgi:hypothetical protein
LTLRCSGHGLTEFLAKIEHFRRRSKHTDIKQSLAKKGINGGRT